MTYSNAQNVVKDQISLLHSQATTQLSRIDWVKVRKFLYNVTVFIGVAIYLVYLAACAVISAGKSVKALWVQYEIGQQIRSAIITLRSEVPSFISDSRKDVEEAYVNAVGKIQQLAKSMASDYRSIRDEVHSVVNR